MAIASVHLIIAEDDDGHAQLIERDLRRAGLANEFVRLRDGQEVLDYFHVADPVRDDRCRDCVLLLDINMPRVDGIEVLRQLKSRPETATIPVIMLTTSDNPRDVERCYGLGCNVYITKPVEHEMFIEAVKRIGFFLQVVKLPTAASGHAAA